MSSSYTEVEMSSSYTEDEMSSNYDSRSIVSSENSSATFATDDDATSAVEEGETTANSMTSNGSSYYKIESRPKRDKRRYEVESELSFTDSDLSSIGSTEFGNDKIANTIFAMLEDQFGNKEEAQHKAPKIEEDAAVAIVALLEEEDFMAKNARQHRKRRHQEEDSSAQHHKRHKRCLKHNPRCMQRHSDVLKKKKKP